MAVQGGPAQCRLKKPRIPKEPAPPPPEASQAEPQEEPTAGRATSALEVYAQLTEERKQEVESLMAQAETMDTNALEDMVGNIQDEIKTEDLDR